MTDTALQADAVARIQAAQRAVRNAQAAFEQAIRDEIHADRITPSDAARALSTKNRQRIYAILGRGTDDTDPSPPALTPVVYLRGRGCGTRTWKAVESAMWARGWATVRDRTTAWHLARGGVPVVLCDFSGEYDGLSTDDVIVGLVRARWRETPDSTEMDLPLISGGHHTKPERHDPTVKNKGGGMGAWVVDETALARLVAAAFTD
ncbi:hypothetical protein [Nocardia paucivorans]|uniref:hypothetical protein n=1 Tax=Nocardia paucivorans TaxID=114259 RepID=UPI0002E76A1D|nr:hypothetical protein [Nocardia paucivorans]